MKRSLLKKIISLLIVILVIDSFILDNKESILLPISAIIIVILLIIDYIITTDKIKQGIYIKIGYYKKQKVNSALLFGLGLIIFCIGLFWNNSIYTWRGIDSHVFFGFIYMLWGTLTFRDNYKLLVKKDRIYTNQIKLEWKFVDIDKIEVQESKIMFYNIPDHVSVDLSQDDINILIDNIPDYLKVKIEFEDKHRA